MLLFLLINFSVQWLQRVDAFFKRLSLDLEFSKFLKVFPSPLHQMFHWNIKNMTKELQSIINCINGNANQTMTANCQIVTSYSRKHQHPLNDFVNRDGINYTNNMSALNTNRNIRIALLGDSLIQGLEFIFPEGHIKMVSGKTTISTRYQTNSYSLRDQ